MQLVGAYNLSCINRKVGIVLKLYHLPGFDLNLAALNRCNYMRGKTAIV